VSTRDPGPPSPDPGPPSPDSGPPSPAPVRAVVVDYGAGNRVRIRNALEAVGATVSVCRSAPDLVGAEVIVVPGVGASGPAMARLRRQGLVRPLRDAAAAGIWLVGICLGMQLLFERSDEDGARMLGLLAGDVVALPDAPRLPHIGWNSLELRRPHPLLAGIADRTPAYFVHSYAPRPRDADIVLAETEHGGRFASVIASGRLVGYQFHPERSGVDGLRLLADLVALVANERSATTAAAPATVHLAPRALATAGRGAA
jgi:glutamine amidotransferase